MDRLIVARSELFWPGGGGVKRRLSSAITESPPRMNSQAAMNTSRSVRFFER